MTGKYQVVVGNNRLQYKFTIQRNITILRGNSATGKTTLIDLIREHNLGGPASGITLSCARECIVLENNTWEMQIASKQSTIFFIDEGNPFITTKAFAELIQETDHYYVIVARESLPMLPYSVEEIYGIKNNTRRNQATGYGTITKTYSSFSHIYSKDTAPRLPRTPDVVIVEDSKAGFEFFRSYFSERKIRCLTADGKSNIASLVAAEPKEHAIFVIADGAAFGPEMEKTFKYTRTKELSLFLPESFEWMILSSGIFKSKKIADILSDPSEHIESRHYFSWEQFFAALLTEETAGTYLHYNKSRLNPVYLQERERGSILSALPESVLE